MSVTRQLAEAIEFVASAVKDLSEAIYERIERESKRITALEDEIERLKKEPHKSFRQKLKEKL
jgi:uncharacterized protein Yka (UPF0111/DUF47 family)